MGGGVYQRGIQALQYVIPGVEQDDADAVEVHVGIVVLENVEDQVVQSRPRPLRR